MTDPDDPFLKLVFEAVRQHDGDMKAVEREVLQRMDAMDPAEREQITEKIRRLLSFHVPGFQEKPN